MPHDSIAEWLSDIGLDQFQAMFAEQRIELEDLPELNEQDLEKLAIPLGPRKRLIKAIVALRSSAAVAQPVSSTGPISHHAFAVPDPHTCTCAGHA